jgi:hypothetical protein
MAFETPGPLVFHVVIWTALGVALIAVMVVLMLN